MCHHTASNPSSDGQSDVNYMVSGSDAAPVANLYLSRSGKVWVMAGGATNTNGSGSDPCGHTPTDSMNTHAIGIEAANNGVGEPWPTVQQDVYVRLVHALCDHYAIPVGRVHSHFEWAPTRKIDPAGSSRYASGSNMWNMDGFRGDVITGGTPTPPTPTPTPTPEGMDETMMFVQHGSGVWLLSGSSLFLIGNTADLTAMQAAAKDPNRVAAVGDTTWSNMVEATQSSGET